MTTNESNEAYERRVAAGTLLAEAPQGAQFQRKGINRPWDIWENIAPEHVLTSLVGCVVRIAPTPKKVLRPFSEIMKIAEDDGLLRMHDNNAVVYMRDGGFHYVQHILKCVGEEKTSIQYAFPDAWFTTEEPKR
jgi:hypothetical protein